MDYQSFNKNLTETINQYKEMLINDFMTNSDFEKLASAMCFNNKIRVKEWIAELELENFEKRKSIGKYHQFKRDLLNFMDVDVIQHRFVYVNIEKYDAYSFFEKYEFDSYSELLAGKTNYFYLCNKEFVKKIDNIFIESLVGYSKSKKYIFSKQLATGFSLKIDTHKSRKHFETIENYTFPTIYIEFKNAKYFFANEIDTFTFFFMGVGSYLYFFYGNRQSSKSTDEPVVYHQEESNKYILTNSYENLERFNKFIYLNTELFIHYFKIFEKWVRDVFIPKILQEEKNTDYSADQ